MFKVGDKIRQKELDKPYSIENLHQMAVELGIKRCWFHKNHYDIPVRRQTEIEGKCTIISSKEIVKIISK
jgi:hypothetical protein